LIAYTILPQGVHVGPRLVGLECLRFAAAFTALRARPFGPAPGAPSALHGTLGGNGHFLPVWQPQFFDQSKKGARAPSTTQQFCSLPKLYQMAEGPAPLSVKDRMSDVCFTCFDVSDAGRDHVMSIPCKYLVFQQERCPDTGREHFQGFIQLGCQLRFNAVKELFPAGTHLERRRGSPTQAADYCQKEESRVAGPWTVGELQGAGKRNDLIECRNAILLGKRGRDLWDDNFTCMAKYHRAMDRYISLCSVPRSWKTEVHVYWGDAGAGKSRKAFDTAVNPYVHDGSCWFDGYADHADVIIDDYTGSIQLDVFLKLLDRYPMQVPIKGGYVNWVPRRIFITSNLQPTDWYPKATGQQHAAIQRRLDTMEFFSNPPAFN